MSGALRRIPSNDPGRIADPQSARIRRISPYPSRRRTSRDDQAPHAGEHPPGQEGEERDRDPRFEQARGI